MNRVTPTLKQLKTLEIKQANPKMPLGTAMRMAGYSKNTAVCPKQNYLEARGVQTAMQQVKARLADLGVTPQFYADKIFEWSTAVRIKSSLTGPDMTVPDYPTQLAVREDLKNILEVHVTGTDGVTRKLTIEEFIQK